MIEKIYKKFKIKIYELDNNDYGYEVFNPQGKVIFKDFEEMGDDGACYQNACGDVEAYLTHPWVCAW